MIPSATQKLYKVGSSPMGKVEHIERESLTSKYEGKTDACISVDRNTTSPRTATGSNLDDCCSLPKNTMDSSDL